MNTRTSYILKGKSKHSAELHNIISLPNPFNDIRSILVETTKQIELFLPLSFTLNARSFILSWKYRNDAQKEDKVNILVFAVQYSY